jgi:hypothetical protein
VKAQRYTASGAANGNAITVATPTLVNGFQGVAMAGAGNFVVTWDDISNRGPNNVFAKQYTASGKSTGGQITVATGDALGLTLWSSVAMNATGQFVVTYEHRGVGRQAQVYNANGTPVPGGPVTFVSGDFIDGTAAAVAMDSAGNATFAWTGNFDDRYGLSDVHMSRLPFGATSAEPVTIVNTTTEGLQSAPSVAATGSGTFVVAWQGYSPSDDAGIYTQRYGQQAQIADFTASANPVTAGTIMTLTASNITDGNPAATINQVTFYYYDSTSTKVSVPGTQTSPGVWTCSIDTTGWTSGSQVTLFAQALDSYGVLSDPLALNLDVL